MKQKKEFVSPEIEIIEFPTEDIMMASGTGSGTGTGTGTNSEIELPDHDW